MGKLTSLMLPNMKNLITKERKNRINGLCDYFGIGIYTINTDGTIDVNQDVDLRYYEISNFPLSFNKVCGDFDCGHNIITSLLGSPRYVSGNYIFTQNRLISTYSGDDDIEVGGGIYLYNNRLPKLIKDNMQHIKLILKYQRHFFIWNDDLTLNEENFQELLDEINDGLE